MKNKSFNYKEILSTPPELLIDWLEEHFYTDIPCEVVSKEDMEVAAKLLLKLSAYYSFLCSLLTRAEIATRQAKRELGKLEYEDMVDRKKAISNAVDIVKQQYQAVSRAVTIHIENMKELNMSGKV